MLRDLGLGPGEDACFHINKVSFQLEDALASGFRSPDFGLHCQVLILQVSLGDTFHC